MTQKYEELRKLVMEQLEIRRNELMKMSKKEIISLCLDYEDEFGLTNIALEKLNAWREKWKITDND